MTPTEWQAKCDNALKVLKKAELETINEVLTRKPAHQNPIGKRPSEFIQNLKTQEGYVDHAMNLYTFKKEPLRRVHRAIEAVTGYQDPIGRTAVAFIYDLKVKS